MDHGHDGHDMGSMCSMNMIWNTQIIDTCIVFSWWHIRSNFDFFLSFIAVVALGVLYEYLREAQGQVDRRIALSLSGDSKSRRNASFVSGRGSPLTEEESLIRRRTLQNPTVPVPIPSRVLRAAFYAATIFLSFFLMLVFMTYNAYLILAVVLGAGLGHYIYGGQMDVESVLNGAAGTKSMACH